MCIFRAITIVFFVTATALPSANSDDKLPPKAFTLCASCHTVMAEGQHRKAPPLTGIVGRPIASWPGFTYSECLNSEEGVWTKERLDSFLTRPNHALPGTKMYFRGLRNNTIRRELIEWLATAEVPAIKQPPTARRKAEITSRAERANHLFNPCTACHSFTQGAPNRIGPNLFGLVGRPVASAPGFDYSERLMRREGVWDNANLHAFFAEQKTFEQGTHAAFRSLTRHEDRDLLIQLLRNLSAPVDSAEATIEEFDEYPTDNIAGKRP